jgi:hypothetical protein
MQTEEMRLDGNAAAGALREIFAQEMTTALATCAGCRTAREIGTLLEYGHAMGIVLRCPGCDTPMLRLVRATGRLHVDVSGITYLTIYE